MQIGKRLFHSRHNISYTCSKFPQGRTFYVRCFDFAFGECDYFPPLRVMAVTCAHKIVNLAFVSIRPLYEEQHGGAGRTAIHGCALRAPSSLRDATSGQVFPQRTSCALPRRSLIGRMRNDCTIYFKVHRQSDHDHEGRWKYRSEKCKQRNIK